MQTNTIQFLSYERGQTIWVIEQFVLYCQQLRYDCTQETETFDGTEIRRFDCLMPSSVTDLMGFYNKRSDLCLSFNVCLAGNTLHVPFYCYSVKNRIYETLLSQHISRNSYHPIEERIRCQACMIRTIDFAHIIIYGMQRTLCRPSPLLHF